MELYYGNRPTDRLRLLRLLPYLLSCLPSVALLLALAAPYVVSEGGWLFPIAALYTPYIYFVSFAVALGWLAARRWFAAGLIAVVAVASIGLVRYYNAPIFNLYSTNGTKVVTLNCESVRLRDSLYQRIATQRSDIVALQRVDEALMEALTDIADDRVMRRYNCATHHQLLTMSRYPIVGRDSIDSFAQITDVVIREDTVRVINAQLHRSLLTQGEYDDEQFRLWAIEYGDRSAYRALEVSRLDSLMAVSPYRMILTVAMEDVAQSYTYGALTSRLNDSYVIRDNMSSESIHNNYIRAGEKHRLEYILLSEGLDVRSYSDMGWSGNHRAVSISIQIQKIK